MEFEVLQFSEQVLLPIFICVILPISIILILSYGKIYREKQRTKILIKAIENNADIDVKKLSEAFAAKKQNKTPREILHTRLLRGCIFALVGIAVALYELLYSDNDRLLLVSFCMIGAGTANLIVYFLTRKDAGKDNVPEAQE